MTAWNISLKPTDTAILFARMQGFLRRRSWYSRKLEFSFIETMEYFGFELISRNDVNDYEVVYTYWMPDCCTVYLKIELDVKGVVLSVTTILDKINPQNRNFEDRKIESGRSMTKYLCEDKMYVSPEIISGLIYCLSEIRDYYDEYRSYMEGW